MPLPLTQAWDHCWSLPSTAALERHLCMVAWRVDSLWKQLLCDMLSCGVVLGPGWVRPPRTPSTLPQTMASVRAGSFEQGTCEWLVAQGEGKLGCIWWVCFCFSVLKLLNPHFFKMLSLPQFPQHTGEWVDGNTFLGIRNNWHDGGHGAWQSAAFAWLSPSRVGEKGPVGRSSSSSTVVLLACCSGGQRLCKDSLL